MPKPLFPNKVTFAHDVRYPHDGRSLQYDRRRNFKSNKYVPRKDPRDWNTAIREYLASEDVDMGANAGGSRTVKKFNRNNRKGKGGGPLPNVKRPLPEGPSNWYKVQVS